MENFCGKCGNKINVNDFFCNYCGLNIKRDNIENNSKKIELSRKKAKSSFIFAIIPIILILFCSIVSGDADESSARGAIGWIIILYYWSVGIPFAVISLIHGIKSLVIKMNFFAILSICIDILPFLLFFLTL